MAKARQDRQTRVGSSSWHSGSELADKQNWFLRGGAEDQGSFWLDCFLLPGARPQVLRFLTGQPPFSRKVVYMQIKPI